jgi:hypothetical protein
MAADISRVRFDPLRDFAGVVLQQGRLLLDADFNELVAVLERRLRAETSDLTSFGPDPDLQGVAWVPRQTPHAFEITASSGNLTIGRGRMYVDGLLAENHGVEVDGFDQLLSERTGTVDTSYLAQPYWPTPDPVPTGGTFLAYLDVWHRELTYLEDPDLVEIAVGVDATARWQTAWQVRLHAVPSGTTCNTDDDDIPGWLDLVRPSDGRLTTHEVEIPPTDDPCELPPEGGYRGLENQTYRVEIHEGGQPDGTATFKWSRENASVAQPVVEMVSTTVLRLASVGRDDVLRISNDDWVEITDDRRELDGQSGEMRQVTVDDAERTITFTGALPANLQPADADEAAARHLRVRRWDSDGLIAVPASDATEIALEHGIAVSFSVATSGGRFRRGDHWIFAARTANADFDRLDHAPPLGVHHHYARLAVVTLPSNATSCRRLWPPLPTEGGESCDCTVCVTPESHSSGVLTVQDAVNQVKDEGGTVCLAAGVYDIADGVEVDGARSLRIKGQGLATILVARGTAMTITSSIGVKVESLAMISGAGAPTAVRVQGAALLDILETAILSFASGEAAAGMAIQLAGVGLLVNLRRNVLVAPVGVGIGGGDSIGLFGAGLRIEDNAVLASSRGVDLGGTAAYLLDCRVTGNDVLASQDTGIRATGAVAPGGSLEIARNRIAGPGAGIVVGADATVDANTINRLGDQSGTDGIVVDVGTLTVQPGHVRITGNRVHDRTGTGIALRTSVLTFMVKQNVLSTVGAGIAIEDKGKADRVAVEDNEVFDVATAEGAKAFAVGIHVANSGSAAVVSNTVARVGPAFKDGTEIAAILATTSEDVRIAGNTVDEIGPQDGFAGFAAGIAVVGPFERASVTDNSSRFGPGAPGPPNGTWWALLIQSAGEVRTRIASDSVVPLESGALAVTGAGVFAVAARGDHAGVASNTLVGGGPGNEPACRVRVGGDVVADANQCRHELAEDPTAMLLQGSSVIASGNRLRGGEAMLIIRTAENRLAAVGNLAPGGTHLNNPGAGLPSPWQPLNPNVS